MPPGNEPPSAAPATPKAMSSRLLTMKFMQRAAASQASSPTVVTTESSSPAKRLKVSHASAASSPNHSLYGEKAVHAALEQEESKRRAAVEQRAAELGDSRWVLDGTTPSGKRIGKRHAVLDVVQVGFAQIDSIGAEEGDEPTGHPGASTPAKFRRFNMKQESQHVKAESSEDETTSSSSDTSDDEPDGPSKNKSRGSDRSTSTNENPRKRAQPSLPRKRSAEQTRAQQLAKERRKKEIKLNQLTSISSAARPNAR